MADYDIAQAFAEIENELIDSMMRNFSRHRAEETEQGYNWTQWQAEQLKALEDYKKNNRNKFGKEFDSLNQKIRETIQEYRRKGNADQEYEILQAIKRGYKLPHGSNKPAFTGTKAIAEFFKLNDRKLEALIKSTTNDLKKAETAVLRMSEDKYRKAIFNAQVYANTGAATYEKAVDMACRDMLRAGLNCVEYKNGARHTLSNYAEMAIRTANKRAYLRGEGERRQARGISTVVVNRRRGGCSHCAKYVGKVYIDDVYSGGKASDGDYPLLSEAIEDGLFHPNCKDSTSTYYEGITTLKPVSDDELKELDRRRKLEEHKNYYDNQAEKNQRIADYSLDSDNKRIYQQRAKASKKKAAEIEKSLKLSAHNNDISVSKVDNTDTLITLEELNDIKTRLSNIGIRNFNNAENLKTSAVMKPFVEQLEYLSEKYGKMFFRIDLVDLDKSDIAQVTPSRVLQLNTRYFNSSAEMNSIIKEFIKKNILPKGADIKYIVTHEWGHYISMDDLRNSKSEIYTLFKRTKAKEFLTKYSKIDIYEYVADLIACSINKIPCKNADKVLKYYTKE